MYSNRGLTVIERRDSFGVSPDEADAQRCLESVLEGLLLPALEGSGPAVARACRSLGCLTKALAMSGHPRVQECLLRVLQLLMGSSGGCQGLSAPLSLSTAQDAATISASLAPETGDDH